MGKACAGLAAVALAAAAICLAPRGGNSTAAGAPQGTGLASKYPGDAGIERDPAVIFAESFERGTLEEIGRRWGDVSNKGGKALALDGDVPPGSAGRRSLKVTATVGENTGGHLYHTFPPGEDEIYARFYVKFAEDCSYIHHFVTIGAQKNPPRWPLGRAGLRPSGAERFTVGIEPWGAGGKYPPPGAWNFYVYWCEMKQSADGRYWGNGIKPSRPALALRGRWQCVEVYIKCNNPPQHDGELALWIDGEQKLYVKRGTPRGPWTGMGFEVLERGGEPFEGFMWRTERDVKVNFFWLMLYVTESALRRNKVADTRLKNTVWFDNIVLARQYVGPIAPR